jgi:hypothetical protein
MFFSAQFKPMCARNGIFSSVIRPCKISINPLRLSGESCSDLAEIFSMTSFHYKKDIILYLDFFSRTVKKLLTIL